MVYWEQATCFSFSCFDIVLFLISLLLACFVNYYIISFVVIYLIISNIIIIIIKRAVSTHVLLDFLAGSITHITHTHTYSSILYIIKKKDNEHVPDPPSIIADT